MTLVRNLFFLISLTIFAFASTAICIFNYNPNVANNQLFIDFYVSLAILLTGVFSIVLYYFKVNIKKDRTIYNAFWPSVRQATLISVAATVLLFLQGLHILDWLIGISIVIVMTLLELFFQTKKEKA